MAKICINCGKKISFLDDPLEIYEGNTLCSACSMNLYTIYENLLKAKNIDDFGSNATKILESISSGYSANTVLLFKEKMLNLYLENYEDLNALMGYPMLLNRLQEHYHRKLYNIREEENTRIQNQKDNDAFLKRNGHTGYYEYMVINVFDSNDGSCDINTLTTKLNELGRQGWHLKCSYANEMGKNSSSAGVGGFSAGTNATIEQNILIFERFLKFSEE